MNWRILMAVGLACTMAIPATALASHMGQYANNPLERDLQGQIPEPDGVVTSVLGFPVQNCVVELPVSGSFSGRCSLAQQATGTGLQPTGAIAPGCTGDNDGAAPPVPLRKLDGQCGLYEIGLRPNGVFAPVVGQQTGPGKIAPPVSEKGICRTLGLGTGCQPGRYAGTIRFLDDHLDFDSVQNAGTGGPTVVIDMNQLLIDLQRGGMSPASGVVLPAIPNAPAPAPSSSALAQSVVPTQHFLWAWYGEWNDVNGNGVLDHCLNCHPFGDAGINEFTWLGACVSFEGPRNPDAIAVGICKEDGNPNLTPPGAPCADPNDFNGCAGTSMTSWIWPGNHHGNGHLGDQPLNQPLFFWINTVTPLNCSDPPTCDDIDNTPNFGNGDDLLGPQNYRGYDATYHDRTGDGGEDNDDTARQWSGYLGGDSSYYGDDGMLVTMVIITGVNCAPNQDVTGFDIQKTPGTTGACTFVDVDRYPTISPAAQELLVGPDCNPATPDVECPDGGLKETLRSNWIVVRETTPSVQKLESSVVDSNTVYQTTQGPLQGQLDDQLLDNGYSREPNVGSASYKDAAGVTHTLTESYVGVAHTNCENAAIFPVGDSRNPTADHDAESDEAAHRGFCNVHTAAPSQPAYRDYANTIVSTPSGPKQVSRGWADLQQVRGVFTDFPITVAAPPCTYCFWFSIDVNVNSDPESGTVLPALRPATDHSRTMGPGRYYFLAIVGLWADHKFTQDESIFPDAYGTISATYPAAADAFPAGDGWVGTVARNSGQWRYRGFTFGPCADFATDKDAGSAGGAKGSHDAAECNPYLDGNVNDPQDYTAEESGGEWQGACDSANMGPMFLAPKDGNLDTQIIAIANYGGGIGPLPANFGAPGVFNYGPGPVDPLEIPVTCNGTSLIVGTTFIYWPQGNLFDDMVLWVNAQISRGAELPGFDNITDVDVYSQYNLPVEVVLPTIPDVL
ncbi:MAG TPA: hypothetical protein VGR28_03570 [Candidatus Thermoplasmatota archaeon]|jgi:hypothetical protein|nr:hypothetical protein [Candidatus Thermoplasmatota archaeon]